MVTRVSCAKMAEPIEMPLMGGGGVTHMGPRYHALDDILTFSLDKAFPQTEASPVDRGQKRPLT